jgi:hypothetical protein
MIQKIIKFDTTAKTIELGKEELIVINGGSFAYDLGFFIRECVISFVNGGGTYGSVAAAADLGMNYKPVH